MKSISIHFLVITYSMSHEICIQIFKYGPIQSNDEEINSLWSSDAILRHRSESTLAQRMACCLTAPSHYLNQCWLFINEVQQHSSDSNFTTDTSAISSKISMRITWMKFHSKLSGANELMSAKVTQAFKGPVFHGTTKQQSTNTEENSWCEIKFFQTWQQT